MFNFIGRSWKYFWAMLTGKLDEVSDPKIQLEQAIREAQSQHRQLKENAANVIANQKQTQMRLNRAMEELEKKNRSARQAVMMAEEAAKNGDEKKMQDYTAAAESFANRLVAIEQEVETLKALSLQQAQSSEQAKAAVQRNATQLQKKLAERQKLLSQLDQAEMQEQMNRAMASLNETVGQETPSFEEVREKIEMRYAKAKGISELEGESVEGRMIEVEQAALNSEAQARLSKIRSELGIESDAAGTGQLATASSGAAEVEAETATSVAVGEAETTEVEKEA